MHTAVLPIPISSQMKPPLTDWPRLASAGSLDVSMPSAKATLCRWYGLSVISLRPGGSAVSTGCTASARLARRR